MKERVQKLQAKFLLRSVDAPDDTLLSQRLYGNGALLPMILMNLTPPLSRLSTKHILKTALIQGVARLTQSSSLFAAQIWV
ncbi:hypothetical protein G6F16_012270 [Rhizopus arrhizus]|nr:hypothetical protein G6F20_008431 [Rhizopus arrhizus]KAG0821106.1 hypothetical protein G6F19_012103 [Rhizopus arrhizus]KAG0862792.1 hypothetical protein G6F16_012270 [Rhizopus arrhizus]KAG0885712.1 hypothetical protein G6F15_003978 [Rhizopus arrhizus]KAG0905409.1 hypothetical protein G6F33_012186 [Rhizopus arrhizus]